MKQFGGWYFPAHEEHLPEWLEKQGVMIDGRLAYQWRKIQAATRHCLRRSLAIDVGGHIGLWSYYLATWFDRVVAFEPVAEHRACFELNVLRSRPNVTLMDCALGFPEDDNATVGIFTRPGSSGDSWVKGKGDIPIRRLDDVMTTILVPKSEGEYAVDFIKLDCEGYELFALQGGQHILQTYHPTVIVEQKPGKATTFGLGEIDAVKYLQSLGYVLREHISGDYILTHP